MGALRCTRTLAHPLRAAAPSSATARDASRIAGQAPALAHAHSPPPTTTRTLTPLSQIKRIGDGSKRFDPTSTGRFGLGFNSTYHLTDTPQFMSGKYCVMLDPHKTHLPGGEAGCRYDMTYRGPELEGETYVDTYHDQFAPFLNIPSDVVPNPPFDGAAASADGTLDCRSFFNGTLFRFPLRTPEAAQRSLITDPAKSIDGATTPAKVLELFESFAAGAKERLLFVKNIDTLAFYTLGGDDGDVASPRLESAALPEGWSAHPDPQGREYYHCAATGVTQWERPPSVLPSSGGLRLVYSASLASLSDEARDARRGLARQLKEELKRRAAAMTPADVVAAEREGLPPKGAAFFDLMAAMGDPARPKKWRGWWRTRCFELNIAVRRPRTIEVVDRWMVSQAVGEDAVAAFAAGTGRAQRLCLLPYVAVAARLERAGVPSTFSRNRLVGKLFCTLPVSDQEPSTLPVHVDARWELDSSRAHILTSTDHQGIGAVRTKWNESMAAQVLPIAYANLIAKLAALAPSLSPQQLYSHFPTKIPAQAWFMRCVKPFYALLKSNGACVMAPAKRGGRWLTVQDAVFCDATTLRHDDASARKDAREHAGIAPTPPGGGRGVDSSDEEDQDISVLHAMISSLPPVGTALTPNEAARHAWSDFISALPTPHRGSESTGRMKRLRLVAKLTARKWGRESHHHGTPRASNVQLRARSRWAKLRLWLASQGDTAAAVERLLGELGFPLTSAPRRIYSELHACGLTPRALNPQLVRSFFSIDAAKHSALRWDGAAPTLPFAAISAQWPAIRGPLELLPLLAYCLSGLESAPGGGGDELVRLPLLPLGDGTEIAIIGTQSAEHRHFIAGRDAVALMTMLGTTDVQDRVVMPAALVRATALVASPVQHAMKLRRFDGSAISDLLADAGAASSSSAPLRLEALQRLWTFMEQWERRPTDGGSAWVHLRYPSKSFSGTNNEWRPSQSSAAGDDRVAETRNSKVSKDGGALRINAKGRIMLRALPTGACVILVHVRLAANGDPHPTMTCPRKSWGPTWHAHDTEGGMSGMMGLSPGKADAKWTLTNAPDNCCDVSEIAVVDSSDVKELRDWFDAFAGSASMARLGSCKLLPLRDGGVAPISDACNVLDAGEDEATVRASDQSALNALSALGCHVLHASVRGAVAHRVNLARINGVGIISALRAVQKRSQRGQFAAQLRAIPAASLSALLYRITEDVALLDDRHITRLKGLPIFRLTSGELTAVTSPPAGLSAWYVEPVSTGGSETVGSANEEDSAPAASAPSLGGRECLRQETRLRGLYARLDLRELSRAVFYVEIVFPGILAMKQSTRLRHLDDVRRCFAEVMAEAAEPDRERFLAMLKELPFVPLPDGKGGKGLVRVRAREVYDPRSTAMASFFPSRTPRAVANSPFGQLKWLQFLEQLGMQRVLTPELIVSVAREIDAAASLTNPTYIGKLTEVTPKTAVKLARTLLLHLSSAPTSSLPAEGDVMWEELSSLALVQLAEPFDGCAGYAEWRRGRRLAPASIVAAYLDRELCWSQLPVMSVFVSGLTMSLSSKLKLKNRIPIETALDHLIFVTENFNTKATQWKLSGRVPFTESRLRNIITLVLSSLSIAMAGNPQVADQVRSTLQGRSFVPVAGSKPLIFVGGDTLFKEIFAQGRQVNLAPFAYRLPESLFFVESAASRKVLLDVVGVRTKPALSDVASWLRRLADDFPGEPLPPTHFNTALTLLQMLTDALGLGRRSGEATSAADAATAEAAAAAANLYAPDSSGVLRAASQLAVNDAPWMAGRVSPTAVRLVHDKVPSEVSRAIGALRLSEIVCERLADGFVPSLAPGADASAVSKIENTWGPNARSRDFRRALCRVMAHEATRAGKPPLFKSDPKVLSALWALGSVQIVPCGRIQSTFVLRASGANVTAPDAETGSQAVLDGHLLYLDVSPPRDGGTPSNLWVAVIVDVLNRSMRSAVANLQPVGYALDAPRPQDIDGVLDYMKVSKYQEADDDEIGVAVSEDDDHALWPAGGGGVAVVGNVVAVIAREGGGNGRYGRVVAHTPARDGWIVQVRRDDGSGGDLTESVPLARLRVFRTAAEMRRAAEQEAAAAVKEHALRREVEASVAAIDAATAAVAAEAGGGATPPPAPATTKKKKKKKKQQQQSLPKTDAFVPDQLPPVPTAPTVKPSKRRGPRQGGVVEIVAEPPMELLPGRTRLGAATKRTLQPGLFEKSALVSDTHRTSFLYATLAHSTNRLPPLPPPTFTPRSIHRGALRKWCGTRTRSAMPRSSSRTRRPRSASSLPLESSTSPRRLEPLCEIVLWSVANVFEKRTSTSRASRPRRSSSMVHRSYSRLWRKRCARRTRREQCRTRRRGKWSG